MHRLDVAIQHNPYSGPRNAQAVLDKLVERLAERGYSSRVFDDRVVMAQAVGDVASDRQLRCIVAAGGDGTIADVINRFPHVPLAILPLGTENLSAKYLGLRRSGRFLADIIAGGRTRKLDVGTVNGRRFLLMASIGFDADVIHRLDAGRRGHIGKLTYLQPIWQSLRKYPHPEFRLYVDGAEVPYSARLAVLANLPIYGFKLPVATSASADDGQIDFRLFQPCSVFQIFRCFYKVALGIHERSADVKSFRGLRARVESDEPVPIQADGDPVGFTPAEIGIEPAALDVFVP